MSEKKITSELFSSLLELSMQIESAKDPSCETCEHWSVGNDACSITMDNTSCGSRCIYYKNIKMQRR